MQQQKHDKQKKRKRRENFSYLAQVPIEIDFEMISCAEVVGHADIAIDVRAHHDGVVCRYKDNPIMVCLRIDNDESRVVEDRHFSKNTD